MASKQGRILLPALSVLLAAAPLAAAQPLSEGRLAAAQSHVMALRAELGLGQDHAFLLRAAHADELGQTHARFQQTYKGVPVWRGEVISHMDRQGLFLAPTKGHFAGISLNVLPSLQASEALAAAHRDLNPKGAYSVQPTAELVVYPETTLVHVRPGTDATAFEEQVLRYRLAYHVHAQLENGAAETVHRDYMVDAHTGAVIAQWNSLRTAAAVGTGHSQWYGTVSLNTNSVSGGYEMRDMTRGTGGTWGNNVTANLNHGTSGNGTIFTDADNDWGNGSGYGSGTTNSTTGAVGQTAAVDAHYGLQSTWDFYNKVLGRNGIDNTGKATYNRMHYSSNYDNAFWDDSCFCMTYGDGAPPSGSYGEADLDTAGHEMSHGVCATTANLTYSGESGGLNESNSDCMGTAVEFYVLGTGGGGSTVPDNPGTGPVTANYTMFENSWGHPGQALRYMYKPSLDGNSPDAWSSTIGNLDVHYSSGPNNRMFYFLCRGSVSDSTSNYYTSYLPNGMTGIGNDHATRIQYRALSTYMTASTNYAAARTALMNAAKDLYGTSSPEYAAVQNAFHGINVGAAATGGNTVTASITTPSGNVTVNSGTAQSFVGTATDSASGQTLSYSWTFGDGGTATGASASHTFTNSGSSAVTYTVTFKATDGTGAAGTATRTVTVNPGATTTLTATITSPSSGTTNVPSGTAVSFAGSASGGTSPYTYTWNFGDGSANATTATATHTFPAAGGDASQSYTVTFTAKDSKGATASATRTIVVNPVTTGGQLITNGGFESGATGWTASSGVIDNSTGEAAHTGSYKAWMDGYGSAHTDTMYQQIVIPAGASPTLSFWLHVDTAETSTTTAYDKLTLTVQNSSGTTLATLATYSNLNKNTGYAQKSFSLGSYAGQTVRIYFKGVEDSSLQTSFVIDDVSAQ